MTKSIENKFQDAIHDQTMLTGAIARLNVIDVIRAAGLVFPKVMPALKEWVEEVDGALLVTVDGDEVEVSLEDWWGEDLPLSENAEPLRKWETAVSQKIREMNPAALLAAGWLEGSECSSCRWGVAYSKKERDEARADVERLMKKAAESTSELLD